MPRCTVAHLDGAGYVQRRVHALCAQLQLAQVLSAQREGARVVTRDPGEERV